jgi:hypothetical protein
VSWIALDDQFHANPKLERAGLAATGLYAKALSYCGCYLTDGFVPACWSGVKSAPPTLKKVLAKGLWVPVLGGEIVDVDAKEGPLQVVMPGRGYFIEDYLHYNPSKAKVEAERARKSKGGRKGASARWSHSL